MKRIFVSTVVGMLLVAAVLLLTLRVSPPAPWFKTVAETNGYDQLLRAGSRISRQPPGSNEDPSSFVQQNQALLEEVRSTLKSPFEAPQDRYSTNSTLLSDLGTFKLAALAMRAQGRSAEQEQNFGSAAQTYTDVIRLGQRIEHGPVISLLAGIAVEQIGLESLGKIEAKIPQEQRAGLAEQLDALNRERLSPQETKSRERFYMRRQTGNPIALLLGEWQLRGAMPRHLQRHQKISADCQQLVQKLRTAQ